MSAFLKNTLDESCPECGVEGKVEETTFPRWKEGVAEVERYCWNCNDYMETIETRELGEEDQIKCHVCRKEFLPEKRIYICPECQETKIIRPTWSSGTEFGLVIPKDTDVVWKHQTGGVACKKVFVEGVFVPLQRPTKYQNPEADYGERGDRRDLLSELQSANYNYDEERVESLWEEIDDELWFEYEKVTPPEDEYHNQEALKWIKITGVEEDTLSRLENLEGKTVAMFYPNCD